MTPNLFSGSPVKQELNENSLFSKQKTEDYYYYDSSEFDSPEESDSNSESNSPEGSHKSGVKSSSESTQQVRELSYYIPHRRGTVFTCVAPMEKILTPSSSNAKIKDLAPLIHKNTGPPPLKN